MSPAAIGFKVVIPMLKFLGCLLVGNLIQFAIDLPLPAGQMGMAILLSCLMCMGTIVVPGGMVITYTFLASSLGLPLESIAILIGIDWYSGMFRTLMNVDVDVMVAMLVSGKMGELDRDVYNEKKKAQYVQQ